MTHVLDSGGLSALAAKRALIAELINREQFSPEIPSVALVECLTGDHRQDHATNRVLALCMVREVDAPLARRAARLRGGTGRAGEISAADAVVVALAETVADAVILTSDPMDLSDLATQSEHRIRIVHTGSGRQDRRVQRHSPCASL